MTSLFHSFRVLTLIAMAMVLVPGCAGTKGAIKAPSKDTREAALKEFKEGAELLYVNNEAAREKFDRAADIDPSFFAAFYNAGVAFEAMGKLNEAASRYESCLAIKKDQGSCLSNLLLVMAKLDQMDKAKNLADRYLHEYKDAPFAYVAAAELALFEKNYQQAEIWARQAIERNPENVQALYVMARVFYAEKQWYAAKFVVKNALELAPSHGGLYLLLGHIYVALDQLHDAIDAYANAVKYQPTEEALESYGLLLLRRGRAKEALPILKRLVEIRPEIERNYLHLGNAYLANNLFDEAREAYFKALALNPDDKDIYFNLGILFLNLKPKDVPEIDRLKTSEGYFRTYLETPGLSSARVKEVEGYLSSLKNKIELEEYAAQAEKEAAEERAKEEERAKQEGTSENETTPTTE